MDTNPTPAPPHPDPRSWENLAMLGRGTLVAVEVMRSKRNPEARIQGTVQGALNGTVRIESVLGSVHHVSRHDLVDWVLMGDGTAPIVLGEDS